MNEYIVRADATVKNAINLCRVASKLIRSESISVRRSFRFEYLDPSTFFGYWRLTMSYLNLILKQKPIVCMLCMTSVLLLLITSAWIRQESASALHFPAMSSLARERLRHVITSEQFQRVLQHNFSSNTINAHMRSSLDTKRASQARHDITDVIRQLSDHGDRRYPSQTSMYVRDTPQSREVMKGKSRSIVKNAQITI